VFKCVKFAKIKQYLGSSTCRICKKCNGGDEYHIDNLVIPSGYLHYIQKHNVKIDDKLKNYLLHNIIPNKQTTIGYWKIL
jgi:hypothetical protein